MLITQEGSTLRAGLTLKESRDNGQENANYYGITGSLLGLYYGIKEKNMETTILELSRVWGYGLGL